MKTPLDHARALLQKAANDLVEIRYDAEFDPSSEKAGEALDTATEVHKLIGSIIESQDSDNAQKPDDKPETTSETE